VATELRLLPAAFGHLRPAAEDETGGGHRAARRSNRCLEAAEGEGQGVDTTELPRGACRPRGGAGRGQRKPFGGTETADLEPPGPLQVGTQSHLPQEQIALRCSWVTSTPAPTPDEVGHADPRRLTPM